MAAVNVNDKATKAGRPQLFTTSEELANITPSTTTSTTGSTEKKGATSLEIRRNSSLSAPPSAHQCQSNNAYDTDIEAMMPQRSCDQLNRKSISGGQAQECPVWPGQNYWKQKTRAAKIKNRSCQCMAQYSKRTRLLIKIGILFLIVGIAVGVGFGVSKPLGASIWKPADH